VLYFVFRTETQQVKVSDQKVPHGMAQKRETHEIVRLVVLVISRVLHCGDSARVCLIFFS
jgi:hypothetical protein